MSVSESLEDLKAIIDNAPDGKSHALNDGGIFTYWSDEDIGCLAISGDSVSLSRMRSLSDIKRIIELMEQAKCVRNETLSDLCHAIEPDGAINSEQGVNTIRAIQRAIMRLVD